MPAPQTVPPIPLPAPTGGVNKRDPLVAMELTDSPWMLNVNAETRSCDVRSGYTIYNTLSDHTAIGALVVQGALLYAIAARAAGNQQILTASGVVTHTAGAGVAIDYPTKFQKNSAFINTTNVANLARYSSDGTTWTTWGFTTGGSPIGGKTVISFKGRVYIFNGTTMYYGGLAAVTGATTSLDLASLFDDTGDIAWAGQLTSPGQRADELLMAIGNAKGEILIYAGDNPGADNWQLVGRFTKAPPVTTNSILEIKNDIWVFTTAGIVSLRRLFQQGVDAGDEALNISAKIDPYWAQLVKKVAA